MLSEENQRHIVSASVHESQLTGNMARELMMRPCFQLRPELQQANNTYGMWLVRYGDLVAYGDSPELAFLEFDRLWDKKDAKVILKKHAAKSEEPNSSGCQWNGPGKCSSDATDTVVDQMGQRGRHWHLCHTHALSSVDAGEAKWLNPPDGSIMDAHGYDR